MNRVLFAVVAAILILGIFANGCTGYTFYLATIHDIDIWADGSSASDYFVDVVIGEHTSCDSFNSYNVTGTGNNTIRVEIINKHITNEPCAEYLKYVEHTFPLGSDFVPGMNYTVEVNDATVDFVPGVIMIYRAPILQIEIWYNTSLPTEYFMGVMVKESCVCDKFDSYNVTHVGNTTIRVDIFNRRYCAGCPDLDPERDDYRAERDCIVPLGSDFVPGVSYTVEVNNVTETFVA